MKALRHIGAIRVQVFAKAAEVLDRPPPYQRGPRAGRIEQSVTSGGGGSIVGKSALAATALLTFVPMPLYQHGSGKAIEHWRG